MTTVEINRHGTDITSLDVFQSGSHESSVNLRHDLLDDRRNYHFAVTSLSVPLNKSPIHKLTKTLELFRIERRDVGGHINDNLTLHIPGGTIAANAVPELFRIFSIRPTDKMYDVSSFVKRIANFCRGFNEFWTLDTLGDGFDPTAGGYGGGVVLEGLSAAEMGQFGLYHLIDVRLTADGTLQFVGSDLFFNNFVIRFKREGAAILGFYDQLRAEDRVGGVGNFADADATHYFITKTLANGEFTNKWVDNAAGHVGEILAGGLLQEVILSSSHPIFQSVDQRIRVTVETHLPTMSNQLIMDEKESVDRSIATAYFESKLENQIRFNESGIFENMMMQSAMYAGQTNFIKKSDPTFQWNRLLTAYEQKLFRFQIYIWYRIWDDATQKWKLDKSPLNVPDQQFWEMSVRFVSDS